MMFRPSKYAPGSPSGVGGHGSSGGSRAYFEDRNRLNLSRDARARYPACSRIMASMRSATISGRDALQFPIDRIFLRQEQPHGLAVGEPERPLCGVHGHGARVRTVASVTVDNSDCSIEGHPARWGNGTKSHRHGFARRHRHKGRPGRQAPVWRLGPQQRVTCAWLKERLPASALPSHTQVSPQRRGLSEAGRGHPARRSVRAERPACPVS